MRLCDLASGGACASRAVCMCSRSVLVFVCLCEPTDACEFMYKYWCFIVQVLVLVCVCANSGTCMRVSVLFT